MPTIREQILTALADGLGGLGFFPPVDLDAPEVTRWRSPIPGEAAVINDYAAVQDGEVQVTRDGGGEDDYELELTASIVYGVQGADRAARRARRDAAASQIEALIAGDRSLGLGDPQIYATITEAHRDDNLPAAEGPVFALLMVTVTVQYIAASPAG